MLGFNILDLFIVVFLALWIRHGYSRGFFIISANFIAFAGSIYLAARTYSLLSSVINSAFLMPRAYANLVAFLVLFGLFHLIFGLIAVKTYPHIVRKLKRWHLCLADRVAGIFPAFVGGLVWLAIFLGIFNWFPISAPVKGLILDSRLGAPIVKFASSVEPEAERIAGKAITDTIAFVTTDRRPGAESRPWKPNIPSVERARFDAAAETYMLELINQERKRRGLRILVPDTRLRDVARAHSLDMVKNNFFDHRSPTTGYPNDRLNTAGIFYLAMGENLAYAQDIDLAHMGLMKSKGHRENILSPFFGKAGIGIVNAGAYGYMCTQEFTN